MSSGGLDRLILAGGPPRSGTTFLARALNSHPRILVAIDNGVYESWALYDYWLQEGLVARLRTRAVSSAEADQYLRDRLIQDGHLVGVAPSVEVNDFPLVPPPSRNARGLRRQMRRLLWRVRRTAGQRDGIPRHRVPLEWLTDRYYVALKSPEIVCVLPRLVTAFPEARVVLVYRPLLETSESMYRKGREWRMSFQRRWRVEVDGRGQMIAPPHIPMEWLGLWSEVSDFQRCVLSAASYMKHMVTGLEQVAGDRAMVYDHARMRVEPGRVLERIAAFIGVEAGGFREAIAMAQPPTARISADLRDEYRELESALRIPEMERALSELDVH